MTNEDRAIRLDRMRYVKNHLSARLCYLAILFDVFFFANIYKSDVGTWYYKLIVGASIVYNLLFMLFVFLGSEGVKNYKDGYTWPLLLVGVAQIARIFILPVQARGALIKIGGVETAVMGSGQFVRAVLYLAVSAVALIAAAIVNRRKCRALAGHLKTLEDPKV